MTEKKTGIRGKLLHRQGAALAAVLFIAALLRFVGIGWGMPYGNLHPDECIIYGQAYQCAADHTFEVKEYSRPNHVTIKLNTLLYIGIQEVYFAPQGLDDFAVNYSEHFALFTTASRVLTALFSMGTVVLAYLTVRIWGRYQALLAALLFALFPPFVEHSHYITPDIPLLFFFMCVLWGALRYLKNPSRKGLFGMCFCTALGFCEKYPGAYGCVIIAVAVCMVYRREPLKILRNGLLAILFFVLGIMAVSPVLIVDLRTVLAAMAGQNAQYHLGGDGLNFGETLLFYMKTAAEHLGLLLMLSSLYGIVRAFLKKTQETVLVSLFLLYILPISVLRVHWERYTLPIYAAGLLFGAVGAFYAAEDLQKLLKGRKGVFAAACALLFLLPVGNAAAGAAAVLGSLLAPDSRIFLQDVFAEMNITSANTVHDCNTPLDPGGYYGAFNEFEDADPSRYKYGVSPAYVMTSSSQRDAYFASEPEIYGGVAQFYRTLDEEYELIYLYSAEEPQSYFLELQNIWYAARSVYRYIRGTASGYEIRLYWIGSD